MFSRFKKGNAAANRQEDSVFLSNSEGSECDYTWGQAAERALREGRIKGSDPRLQISPKEVKELGELSVTEIYAAVDAAVGKARSATPSQRDKITLAALSKIGREDLDMIASRQPTQGADRAAKLAEKAGMELHGMNPGNPESKRLLAISAASHDRVRKDRDLAGFENNSISEAAFKQGRTWFEARDALLAHGALQEEDPRRKVHQIDADGAAQRAGSVQQAFKLLNPSEQLPRHGQTQATRLEKLAMDAHRDPSKREVVSLALAVSASVVGKEKERGRGGDAR